MVGKLKKVCEDLETVESEEFKRSIYAGWSKAHKWLGIFVQYIYTMW